MFFGPILAIIGLWLGVHYAFVLTMAAKSALTRSELTPYWMVLLAPAAFVGLVLDVVFQLTIGWILFAESPLVGGLLFSHRVQYHYDHAIG